VTAFVLLLPLLSVPPIQNLCQCAIELIRERLKVLLVLRFRPTGFHSRGPKLFHQVTGCQATMNCRIVEQFTSRANRDAPSFDNSGGKRDICSDHHVAGSHLIDDQVIGDIRSVPNRNAANQVRLGNRNGLIGNQCGFDLQSKCSSKQQFLDGDRTGIGINPKHRTAIWSLGQEAATSVDEVDSTASNDNACVGLEHYHNRAVCGVG